MTRGHVNYRSTHTHAHIARETPPHPQRHNTYYMRVLQVTGYFVAIFQPADTERECKCESGRERAIVRERERQCKRHRELENQ